MGCVRKRVVLVVCANRAPKEVGVEAQVEVPSLRLFV